MKDQNLKKKGKRFIRQDAHKKESLRNIWRRPKGLHNKVRLGLRGYRQKPTTGYCSPTASRGKTKEGLAIVRVTKVQELANLKSKEHIVVLNADLGKKKRIVLLEELKKKGLRWLGGDVEQESAKLSKEFESRKKKASEKKAEKSKKESKSIEEKVKKDDEAVSDEDKKKKEKELKDKVLTKKG